MARVFVANEPPCDLIALDIVRSQDPRVGLRTFVDPACYDPDGVAAGHVTTPLRYYLFRTAGIAVTPTEFLSGPLDRWFKINPLTTPADVAADIIHSPGPKSIVVWDILPRDHWDQASELDALLGSVWKRQSCDVFAVREATNWGHHFNYRRLSYVRVG